MPTRCPCSAIATARFAVSDDLPTPPLPEAIPITLVSEPGAANGMNRSAAPPRKRDFTLPRCSSFITVNVRLTLEIPARGATAAVTSAVSRSFMGHPAIVRRIPMVATPASSTTTLSTMSNSVRGRRSSGSLTPLRARVISAYNSFVIIAFSLC